MPGRKPLASAIHKKNGSYQKNPQRENKNEPKPPSGAPKMPLTVAGDPAAKRKWAEVIKVLGEMEILSRADKDLLEIFCLNYSHYCALLKAVRDSGFAQQDASGFFKRNPLAGELAKVTDRQARLLGEMGLTPSSRTRVGKIDKNDEPTSFDRWISNGGLN